MASFDEKLLQELQSKIDSMSISEAMEALQAAKAQVELLRQQQTAAAAECQNATVEADCAKKAYVFIYWCRDLVCISSHSEFFNFYR